MAGHLELRDRAGAAIHLGARAKAEYSFVAMKDGDTLRLGPDVSLQALETPGHTPESISIVVFDGRQGAPDGARAAGESGRPPVEPWAVLTGDTLFVG